jgi:predicted ATPase with chaperone activity
MDLTKRSIVPRPRNLQETGLSADFVAALVCKNLHVYGVSDLHQISKQIALSGNILDNILDGLRKKNLIEILAASHGSTGERYALTDKGHVEALLALSHSGYTGSAPVPIEQYKKVVQAQSVQHCKITRANVLSAFKGVTIKAAVLDQLGPAMHSGRAIMIYGLPGTGKTYICKKLTRLLGEAIFIPHAICVGESIVQLYDPVIHQPVDEENDNLNVQLHQGYDPRFLKCLRPVAVSGGELTLDMLEIEHDRNTHLSQAPLQLKANNGMYIIDDLGRQRVPPVDLFNRWIVPLEEKHDYLSLDTGKRLQVPFDVILLFSANINPADLMDEAFLRRLGYKIKFAPLNETEYKEVWDLYAKELDIEYTEQVLEEALARYRQEMRPLLPCQPRDLLGLISDQCQYAGEAGVATSKRLHTAWDTYFINLDFAKVDS